MRIIYYLGDFPGLRALMLVFTIVTQFTTVRYDMMEAADDIIFCSYYTRNSFQHWAQDS
jgi:hypothetical protein